MSRYNRGYRKSSDKLIETLKIAIKRNSVEREQLERSRVNMLSPPAMMDTEEIFDLIPAFSPSSSYSLSAEKWIETIEDIKVIYGWDDRLTLVYASLRLEDAAKRWFKDNLCDWPEFKAKFIRRFSNRISKEEYFEQLQRRRKEYNESYENYVYDMERTAIKCGCSVESTINYIISGLRDSELRSQLIACNCKTVDELFSRINKFTAVNKKNDDLRNQLGRFSKNIAKEAPREINLNYKVCSQCRKPGHYATNCRLEFGVDEREEPRQEPALKEPVVKRSVMCVRCKEIGHYASECFLNEVVCNSCKREGRHPCYCFKDRRDRESSENSREETRINIQVYCLKCKVQGHHTKDCNFKEAYCDYCKRKGHKALNCHFKVDKDLREQRRDKRLSDDSWRELFDSESFCTKCMIKGHHTSNCGGNSREPFCISCKRSGHTTIECRIKVRNEFHEERKDEQNLELFRRDTKMHTKLICSKCRKEGHHTVDCKLNSKEVYFNEAFCHNCKQKGHRSIDCRLSVDRNIEEERRESRNSKHVSQDAKMESRHNKNSNGRERSRYESENFSKEIHINPNVILKIRDEKRNEACVPEYIGFCRFCRIEGHYTEDCKFNRKHDHRLKEYSFEEKIVRDKKEDLNASLRDSKKTCYNCRRTGHYAANCTMGVNLKRRIESNSNGPTAKNICISEKQIERNCSECKLSGHLAFECPLKSLTATRDAAQEKLTAALILSRNLSELLKPVRIDNVYVTALVNLGSDCTTLQRSEFEKHDWKIKPCSLELNGSSNTIGKISKNVCVGEVELMIDILIVEDSIQDFPLVLGSNFLDHPSVCVVKKYRSLEIKLDDSYKKKPPTPPMIGSQGQLKIKTEPGVDTEENHLLELLDMMEQDYE